LKEPAMKEEKRNSRKQEEGRQEAPVKQLIAKKDFEIFHNRYHLVIKAGDNLKDVPELYLANLKTEGVI